MKDKRRIFSRNGILTKLFKGILIFSGCYDSFDKKEKGKEERLGATK